MSNKELKDVVERVKSILVEVATGSDFRREHLTQNEYRSLRSRLLASPIVNTKVPDFVRACRELNEFWGYIKQRSKTYQERREFLANSFDPLLTKLESAPISPLDEQLAGPLRNLDYDEVSSIWEKALDRRANDPQGAITMARTLLESTIKHILDEIGVQYNQEADLPRLFQLMSKELHLAPSQHTEKLYKQILGGCTSVVEGLGAVRSKLGDAHGRGKKPPRPSARHAELSVNLAGAMAGFCLQSWQEIKQKRGPLLPDSSFESEKP